MYMLASLLLDCQMYMNTMKHPFEMRVLFFASFPSSTGRSLSAVFSDKKTSCGVRREGMGRGGSTEHKVIKRFTRYS